MLDFILVCDILINFSSLHACLRPAKRRGRNFSSKTNALYFDNVLFFEVDTFKLVLRNVCRLRELSSKSKLYIKFSRK